MHSQASTSHRNIKSSDLSLSAQAPDNPLGLGLMLGDMNGISGKYWLTDRNAVDAGFSYSADDYATLHSDYLWNASELLGLPGRSKKNRSVISPYFGIGAILFFDTSNGSGNQSALFQKLKSTGLALGARVPVGVEFQPSLIPCGIFGELAPGTILVPGMVGILDGEVGIRFYM